MYYKYYKCLLKCESKNLTSEKQKTVVAGAQERWWRTDRGWLARTEVLLDRRAPHAF